MRISKTKTVWSLSLFSILLLAVSVTSVFSAPGAWKPSAALSDLDAQTAKVMVQVASESNSKIILNYATPDLTFKKVDYQAVQGTATEQCAMGNARILSEPGLPEVPYIYSRVILPPGKSVANIRIIAKKTVQSKEAHTLSYGEIPHPLSSTTITWAKPANDVYASATEYPAKTHELESIQYRCGVAIAYVNIFPVRYIPKTGAISLIKDFAIEITLKAAPAQTNGIRLRAERLQEGYASTEENPSMLNAYAGIDTKESLGYVLCNPREDFDWVVVSNASIISATTTPSLSDLVKHRESKGLKCKVMDMADVNANYQGSSSKDKLRNFIKDAYNNWNTKFVLLGGDTQIIPLMTQRASNGGTSDNLPTDLPYQCLDGSSWNNDWEAEVQIGRFSAENTTEFANQVFKTIAYETSPVGSPYLTYGLSVGEELDSRTYAKPAMKDLESYFPNDYSWDGLYDQDGKWNKSRLIQMFNQSKYSICNHFGHSNTSYVMKMRNGDERNLTNDKFLFAKSQGCIPGAFDRDCIGERMTNSTRTAFFAVVFNSRYGWYSPGRPTGGSSHKLHQKFWEGCWQKELTYFSEFNEYSHRTNTRRKWDCFASNLLGDPATPFRGKQVGPYLQVLQPTSGHFYVGDKLSIKWEVGGGANVQNVKLEYSVDGGSSFKTIEASIANTSPYEWTLPETAVSEKCIIQISEVGGTLIGKSGQFTIAQKAAIALNPASLSAQGGQNQSIDKTLKIENKGKGKLDYAITMAGAPSPIIINELYVSVDAFFDGLELWNQGPDQDMSGWKVQWKDNQNTSGSFSFPGSFVLKSGKTVVLMDDQSLANDSTFYVGNNMFWDQGVTELSVSLINPLGRGVDFVKSAGNNDDPPAGTSWNGAGITLNQNYMFRKGNGDTDTKEDWTGGANGSPNALNPNQSNGTWSYWLSVTPTEGTVNGLQNLDVKVTFNSKGLTTGTYKDTLVITHNSADITSPVKVPCTFTVDQNAIINGLHALNSFGLRYYNSRLTYQLPTHLGAKKAAVRITLFNAQGKLIRTLVHDQKSSGIYTLSLNGTQSRLASGLYFVKMKVLDYNKTIKIIKK